MFQTSRSHSRQSLRGQQGGYAAFAVTLILMVVLSLIVLGFANNARQEQRRALDNQLSTAAYYGAESGINDAYAVIDELYQNNLPIPAQTSSCNTPNSGPPVYIVGNSNTLEGQDSYSCLLVNPAPPTLEYQPVGVDYGQVVPMFGEDSNFASQPLNTITISWQEDGVSPTDFSGCPENTGGNFPPQSQWPAASCTAGVLQVDIVPAGGWGSSESSLQNAQRTVFLEPLANNSGGSLTAAPATNGKVTGVRCGANPSGGSYDCSATITNLPASPADPTIDPAGGAYYLHIVPIYETADLSITGYSGVSVSTASPGDADQLNLANAQALIDSTGKANDVLKRIQERVSINPVGNNDLPASALQSTTSICKFFTSRPSDTVGAGTPGNSC